MEKNWYSFDEKLVVRHMVNFPSFYGYAHSSSSRMWCPRSIRPRSGAAVSGGGWKHTSQLWDIGTPEVKQGRRPKNCVEVELVRQVHTLVVRSAQVKVVFELQVPEEVEGVRQEVREVEGDSKVEECRSLHEHVWMTWMTNTRLMT